MDFLKTLLAYMAASLVVAVESTSTPMVTPVPTPAPVTAAPTAVVAVTEMPTEAVTATPTVSVTPASVPTITPNTKGYHNLIVGDRGEDVRKLQERLIELGYLPEGAADGAYGGQTRNAVRLFQYYNGLEMDGIAGRATQTNLFENPDAAAKPTEPPTPTPEPAPEEPEETDEAEDPAESDEAGDLTDSGLEDLAEDPAEIKEAGKPAAAAEMEASDEKTEAGAAEAETPAVSAAAATETPEPTVTAEPTETPEPTVTPYVVAPATEIPWGDEPTPAKERELTTDAPEAVETDAQESAEPETSETPEAEPSETPAAETAEAETAASPAAEEVVEEVNLDEVTPTPAPTETPEIIEYEDLAGWVVLNNAETPLQWTEEIEGAEVVRSPRMQRAEEDIRVSLDDLVRCVESWTLHDEGDSLILEAQGFTLALLKENGGLVATVDGLELETDAYDFSFEEGHYIRAELLTAAMDGEWAWAGEEETLTLEIPEKWQEEAE